MSNKTLKEIEDTVAEAYKQNAVLSVEGYISSDGSVCSMTLAFLGPDGYKKTLEESLRMLQKGEVDLTTSEGLAVGSQAAAALSASWAKSLHGLHDKRTYKEPRDHAVLEKHGFTNNSRDQVVITNMRVLHRIAEKNVERNAGNTPLVRAKKEILARTPMDSFRGQLNLSPDKIRDINII